MAHDVFVSYSSRDNSVALAVVKALEANGIRCWIAPRDIKAGDVWAQAIVDAIGSAKALVLVFSSNANRSGHLVNEVDAAIRKGVTPIAFRVEDVMPEGAMEYHLRTRHWMDALSPNLDQHLAELVATVRQVLQLAPAAPVPSTEYGTFGSTPPVPPTPSKSRPRVESTDTSFNLKVPKRLTLPPKALLIGLATLGGALLWGAYRWRGSGDTIGVKFEYRGDIGGTRLTVPIETRAIKFFEGPAQSPPFGSADRVYGKTFAAAQTRYVHTEVTLALAAPGRLLVLPIGCTVYSAADAVVGSFTIESTIQANAVFWVNERPLGADRPGSWKPGRYHVDCKYGEKLVARGAFAIAG